MRVLSPRVVILKTARYPVKKPKVSFYSLSITSEGNKFFEESFVSKDLIQQFLESNASEHMDVDNTKPVEIFDNKQVIEGTSLDCSFSKRTILAICWSRRNRR